MQPHLTSSMREPPVRIQIGGPSSSLGTAACRTELKLVQGQSGDRADHHTQELDMETISITTTSTELHTPANKMIDIDQVACRIFSRDFMVSAEGSVHLNQPAGTSEMAIFDVQSESSMESGRGLMPFKHTEGVSFPPCISTMEDSVLLPERPIQFIAPCDSSMVDSGFSEGLPLVSGMMDSVLSSERPISPSDFIQRNPSPSSPAPIQDPEIPPDLLNEIDQLLAETSENITWDRTQQLDLNLFSHCEEQDPLDDIVQELGILDEIKSMNQFQSKENMPNLKVKEEGRVQCRSDTHNFTMKKELSHWKEGVPRPNSTAIKEELNPRKGEVPNLTVSTSMNQPSRKQIDCVGPVRTRQTRRNCRKPIRYSRTKWLDDELAKAEDTVVTDLDDIVVSTSSTTFTRRKEDDNKELSKEEKYTRSREQNNVASKRCREKRKENLKKMEMELDELESKNNDLQEKVEKLTQLRDNFKDFVNKFLIQRMTQKL